MKWLISLLGFRTIKLVDLTKEEEQRIVQQMLQIDRMLDYWEMQKQGAFELYARSDDRKFLGVAMMAETFLNRFKQLQEPELKEPSNEESGYESSV